MTTSQRESIQDHIRDCATCERLLAESSLGTSDVVEATDVWFEETQVLSADQIYKAAEQKIEATGSLPQVPGYALLAEIGRGGMGVVYRARHLALNRIVALKTIRSAALADPRQLARFKTEAESLAQIQHPHIVQVFEIGDVDGTPFLTMEFVAGRTLAEAILSGGFTPTQSARWVELLARAMWSAHQCGVLHRDLKPSNILLSEASEPKITDFGLAKCMTNDSQMTVAETIMGTPSYMPPEQAQGRLDEVGPRSDIYALGAILYELLTGRPPFRGSTPLETVQQVVAHDPPPPRQLAPKSPRDLETICLKCLRKQPADRYATAADLADAIMTGVAVAVWQQHQTAKARAATQQQYDRFTAEADEKFSLIQDLMQRIPEDQRAQDDRLRSALTSYEKWLAEEPSGEAAQASYADALFRVAEIRRRIGQYEQAEPVYRRACDRYRQLLTTSPDHLAYRHGWAEALNWLGESFRESGRPAEAIATYEEAMAQLLQLAQRANDASLYQADIARSHYNRALARIDLQMHAEAEQDLRRSIDMLTAVTGASAESEPVRQSLARSHANLGILLRATERAAEGYQHYLQATAIYQSLTDRAPRKSEYRLERAVALNNLANLLYGDLRRQELGLSDGPEQASAAYETAINILRDLVREFANVPRYRKELANSLNGLGAVKLDAK
ncbi:MAG: serine/threonine protein kinase, partial [Planctomycetia bacterium]|nr:serine/threonine protein kinase [Planctomycetia bacterium]